METHGHKDGYLGEAIEIIKLVAEINQQIVTLLEQLSKPVQYYYTENKDAHNG